MEGEEAGTRKRMKQTVEDKQIVVADMTAVENGEEETENVVPISEQMQLDIARILEKIESFTTLVSELMESGKSLLQELSNEFEERMISMHKEQIAKWQEEIKELRMLDASNEEASNLLHNARYLLHNVNDDS